MREIGRLEALVNAERAHSVTLSGLLQDEREELQRTRDLLFILSGGSRTSKESLESAQPIGGFETPSAKAARMSRESFDRVKQRKET